ncbi:hypothetical protein [Vibrio parahaemolyticus]|uniref:hypothetical protein n=1 Tax=Vibrio parahaemolyticus TaxID=670 RepID=UPI001110E702|nr:hypothetical protein [Vibrio parahaemolyticus]TMX33742.1 hypothetical protein DA098_25465 [Vibrio parahaemolyticus]TMX79714.1 hypothetical protein DA094_05675 [Vibrio parahaemolyticus]
MSLEVILLPALLMLISVTMKGFIFNEYGPWMALACVLIGIPVDLSFVILPLAFDSSYFAAEYAKYQGVTIAGIIFISIIQLGLFFKPSMNHFKNEDYLKSLGYGIPNALITSGLYYVLITIVITGGASSNG